MAGEIDRGVEYLLRSLELARAHEHEYRISSALGMLGTGLGEMYELERSQHYLEEQIAFGEERDLLVAYSKSWLACVHAYRGRWDEASALARAVLTSGHPISEITGRIALGRVRARRGDPGRSTCSTRRSSWRSRAATCSGSGTSHAARAEAAWLAGTAAGGRGGARRLSARAREAPPLVRGRARVLAVEGGSAGGGARLGRRALPAPARGRRAAPRTRGGRAAAPTRRRGRSRRRTTTRPARGAGRARPPRRRTGGGRALRRRLGLRPRAARGDAR